MITKLTLKNFKSFGATGGEIPLGPLTLIVGTNASGKSNIRDALRFLHGIGRGYSLPEIIGGKYSEAGEHVWDEIRGTMTELVKKGTKSRSFCITVETSADLDGVDFEDPGKATIRPYGPFRYHIEILVDEDKGTALVKHEYLEEIGKHIVFTTHPGKPKGKLPAMYVFSKSKDGLFFDGQAGGPRMTADSPLLAQITASRESHKEPLLACSAFQTALMVSRFFELDPQAMRQPSLPGMKSLTDVGGNLSSVLARIAEDPNSKEALLSWVGVLTPLELVDLEFPKVTLGGKIQLALKEAGGHVISADSTSDGTLRFLAYASEMLWPAQNEIFFIEELENGIHPNRIDLLLRLFKFAIDEGNAQIIATTHSPALLNLLRDRSFEDAVVLTRSRNGSEARCFRDMPVADQDKYRAGDLLFAGWFETTAAYMDEDRDEGGKP
jgi:predicted ATPase